MVGAYGVDQYKYRSDRSCGWGVDSSRAPEADDSFSGRDTAGPGGANQPGGWGRGDDRRSWCVRERDPERVRAPGLHGGGKLRLDKGDGNFDPPRNTGAGWSAGNFHSDV